MYQNNYPLLFCLKWFGVLQLQQCRTSNNKYEITYVGLILKYLSLTYIIVVPFLNFVKVLERSFALFNNSTLFFTEACGLVCIIIFSVALLNTDCGNINKIIKWLEKLDLIFTTNQNIYFLSASLTIFFLINYCPVIFIFIKQDVEKDLYSLLIGLTYHIAYSKCSLLIYFTVSCVYKLHLQLNAVNRKLIIYSKNLKINKPNISLFEFNIANALKNHNYLCELLEEFNEIYGFVRAASILLISSELSITAFWLIVKLVAWNNKDVMDAIVQIWWLVFNIVNLTMPFYFCKKCIKEVKIKIVILVEFASLIYHMIKFQARRTIYTIQELFNHKNVSENIKVKLFSYSLQMCFRKCEITCGDIFSLNLEVLLQVPV